MHNTLWNNVGHYMYTRYISKISTLKYRILSSFPIVPIGAKRIVFSIILHTLFIGRNEQVEEKIAGAVN